MPGCPKLIVTLKAILWTSSRGKVATMLLLLCYSFLYIYISMYIFIHLFSILTKSLLWRYWGDILLFASVPIVPLWGAATSLRGTPLVPKLETSRPSGAITPVVAL